MNIISLLFSKEAEKYIENAQSQFGCFNLSERFTIFEPAKSNHQICQLISTQEENEMSTHCPENSLGNGSQKRASSSAQNLFCCSDFRGL